MPRRGGFDFFAGGFFDRFGRRVFGGPRGRGRRLRRFARFRGRLRRLFGMGGVFRMFRVRRVFGVDLVFGLGRVFGMSRMP